MATCPNCEAPLSWNATDCAACLSIFDDTGWQPVPSSEAEEKLALAARQAREDARRPLLLQTGEMKIWPGKRSVKIRIRNPRQTIWILGLLHVGFACMVLLLAHTLGRDDTMIFFYMLLLLLPFTLIWGLSNAASVTIFPAGRLVRRIGWWRWQVELGTPLRVELAPYANPETKEPAIWGVMVVGPRGAECVASSNAFAAETWRREIARLLALVKPDSQA